MRRVEAGTASFAGAYRGLCRPAPSRGSEPDSQLREIVLRNGRNSHRGIGLVGGMVLAEWTTMVRALLPREHGAYAEILLPLAAVMMAGEPRITSVLLAVVALAGFLAHEPIALLLGRRGMRARDEHRAASLSWLAVLAVVGSVCAAGALRGADAVLVRAAIAPVGLAAATGGLLLLRRERTTAGEIVAATALASTAIPVGVAAGLSAPTAIAIAAVWSIGAALATATVRGIILAAKQRQSIQPEAATTAAVLVLAVAAALSAVGEVPAWIPPALCPLAFVSVALGAFRPRPSNVRQVGWSLVGANFVTLAIVVSGV